MPDKPVVTVPDTAPPTDLVKIDDVVGDGPEAASGQTVTVHYVGVSWSTGQQFDASWDRREPFQFGLGAGMVIQGWDDGVIGMKKGGRRILVIPADQAYGPTGQPPTIPADSPLVFVVDMLKITPAKAGGTTATTP